MGSEKKAVSSKKKAPNRTSGRKKSSLDARKTRQRRNAIKKKRNSTTKYSGRLASSRETRQSNLKTKKKNSKGQYERRKKNKKRKKRGRTAKSILVDLGITFAVFAVIIYLVFRFVVAFPKVNGYAMTPNYYDGDRVFIYRHGKVKRNTVILLQVPDREDGTTNIRRVIGLPGERIEFKDDVLYVNGEEKVERFLGEQIAKAKEEGYLLTENFTVSDFSPDGKSTIPEGYYLVLGDNRSFSADSRSYGLVPEKNIIGTLEWVFRLD